MKNIIKAIGVFLLTFILQGILMGIVMGTNDSNNIMQSIYLLGGVVSFWGYLIYKKIK